MIKLFFFHRLSINSILFFLLFFTIIFDFRSSSDTSNLPVAILGITNFISGLILILKKNKIEKRIMIFLIPFWFFSIGSTFVGLLRGQEFFSVFAQIIPVLLFCNVALIVAIFSENFEKLMRIVNISILSAIFSAIWKLFFSFYYYDLNIETVRYQIISGATILLFSYGASGFILQKQRMMFFSLLLSLGVVFISVTRTYILVFLISILLAFFSLPLKLMFIKLRKFINAIFVLFVLFILFYFTEPLIVERWVARIFSSRETGGQDITSLTRIAEIKGQLEYLFNDILGFLFGFGISANTYWSGQELHEIISTLGVNFETVGYSYGHNLYVGSLYVGGVIFSIPMLFCILFTPLYGIYFFKKNYNKMESYHIFILFFSICSVLGYLVYGMMAGLLGDRSIAFYYGIAFGLLIRSLNIRLKSSNSS